MSSSKSSFAFAARLLASATLAAVALGATSARAQIEPNPPPPSIGSDIPATYFGPAPSSVDKFLVGPLQLLTAGKVDLDAVTVTVTLYTGQLQDGRKVWSIFTDTDDEANAVALGLNFSSKLTYAALCGTARHAVTELDGSLTFDVGTVNFSPEHTITAGSPSAFPPKAATPRSVGHKDYTPLPALGNPGNHLYTPP